jgi:hypothetical protein
MTARAHLYTLVGAILLVVFHYLTTVTLPNAQHYDGMHTAIINGTADSPYRYRILIPTLLAGASAPMALWYGLVEALGIAVMLIGLRSFLRRFFCDEHVTIAVLVAALSFMIASRDHWVQSWTWIEAALMVLAFAQAFRIYEMRATVIDRLAYALLVVFACLNRETGLFVALLYVLLALGYRRKHEFLWGCFYLALFAVIFLGLRLMLGNIDLQYSPALLLRHNLDQAAYSAASLFLLLGAWWWFSLYGYRRAPRFFRYATWIIPPYVVLWFLFAVWYETRLIVPLYPLLLPLALYGTLSPDRIHTNQIQR